MSREAGWATYIMAWKEGMSMWAGTDRSGTHLVAELDEGLGPRELWRRDGRVSGAGSSSDGELTVKGLSRVPKPPTRIRACEAKRVSVLQRGTGAHLSSLYGRGEAR